MVWLVAEGAIMRAALRGSSTSVRRGVRHVTRALGCLPPLWRAPAPVVHHAAGVRGLSVAHHSALHQLGLSLTHQGRESMALCYVGGLEGEGRCCFCGTDTTTIV